MSFDKEHIPVNLEDELNRLQREYNNLAALCSIKKLARGTPEHASQEKQIKILKHEMEEAVISVGSSKHHSGVKKNEHAKQSICKSVLDYENLLYKLRQEKEKDAEVDILNDLAKKNVLDMIKEVPSQNIEIQMLERANNSLRRMENRLDLANKQLCYINSNNKLMREEIHRLLIEQKVFNIQWHLTIDQLVKGKGYLMDIIEAASIAFAKRDEYRKKLEVLKWKGLFQHNKDILAMIHCQRNLNHIVKLEEFLRVKSSTRVLPVDKLEALKEEDIAQCDKAIATYDDLLQQIFTFTECDSIDAIRKLFQGHETRNLSVFKRLCEVMQEAIFISGEVDIIRQRIVDNLEEKKAFKEIRMKEILDLRTQLNKQQKRTQHQHKRITKCDVTPLLKLLGDHRPNKLTVHKYLSILESEVNSLVQIAYGVQPSPETSKTEKDACKNIVAQPQVKTFRPNKLEQLVPYIPCAYCVEEYIMGIPDVDPVVPADKEFIQGIFHLNEPNTKFGIYSLTDPDRRHGFQDI